MVKKCYIITDKKDLFLSTGRGKEFAFEFARAYAKKYFKEEVKELETGDVLYLYDFTDRLWALPTKVATRPTLNKLKRIGL